MNNNGLNSLLKERDFKCVRKKLKSQLIPLINEINLYVKSDKLKKYTIDTVKNKLLKKRAHYDAEVFQTFINYYIKEIGEHLATYKHNLQILRPKKSESMLDMQDINAYLSDNFHFKTVGLVIPQEDD
jgi:hypothetical protein